MKKLSIVSILITIVFMNMHGLFAIEVTYKRVSAISNAIEVFSEDEVLIAGEKVEK